ncbi:MAG: Clp protease ClpP [Bacteroidetes bacterium]|nr:Clp protease ClpP [Bacteroidota bacterium]
MAKQSKKVGKVYLYGEINECNENSAVNFMRRYKDASNGADEMRLHLHSVGGSCFDANVICNTIAQSSVPCDVYIDGIAASMASIIMLYSRKTYMAENAFIMIHSPWTAIVGTAEDLEKAAKLLRSLCENAIEAYSKRTKKTPEEVAEWLIGDNWFSAKEALAEGLIDGIVEDVSSLPEIQLEEEIRNSSVGAIYRHYKATLINNQKVEQMDKASLIKKFNLEGVTVDSSDADVEAALDAKMQAKDAAVMAAKDNQISDIVGTAIEEKKITEKQKDTYLNIGKTSGVEALKAVLGDIKPQMSISSVINANNQSQSQDEVRASWNFDKWQEKDPRGLEKMEKEDNKAFMLLYQAKYSN